MDTITIQGLSIKTHIGIHAYEKAIEQTLLIDIVAGLTLPVAEVQLKDSIDYAAVAQHIAEILNAKRFDLIEQVANTLAAALKKKFDIERISITVSKPHALPLAKNVSVTITR